MSSRVGFVGEGPTDFSVFKAALMAVPAGKSLVAVPLQPPFDKLSDASDQGEFGGGWKGVLSWCDKNGPSIIPDMLCNLRCVVIHIDLEVVFESEAAKHGLPEYPTPISNAGGVASHLEKALRERLNCPDNQRVVFMLPCQATETWIIPAFFAKIPENLECDVDPVDWLKAKSPRFVRMKDGRPVKKVGAYKDSCDALSKNWGKVTAVCIMADIFTKALEGAILDDGAQVK